MKDRDFSRKDPKKNFIKKRSSGGSSSGGNSDNIMDLVKMARQGKGGMSIKDGKKLPKRK
jgi:hypothetical protein